ncbi:hypothetical protein IFM51744_07976 [Aspergillus udagawae]|nr:hypothetical protein IFM51744_07976 [Aspergillus udagawae]
MSSPVPFFYRNPPDDVYSFNFNIASGSSNQAENFSLHYPVQEGSLAFATGRTATTYPPQGIPPDTASQFRWHFPVSTASLPAYTPALLPVNPESSLNQLRDNTHSVESRLRQSQGYIIEHGAQGDSIPPFINPVFPLQPIRQDEARQTAGNLLPVRNAHLVCKWEGCTYKKPFNRKADLSRHVESMHIAPRSYCCLAEGCYRLFSRKDKRDAHMLERHLVSGLERQPDV